MDHSWYLTRSKLWYTEGGSGILTTRIILGRFVWVCLREMEVSSIEGFHYWLRCILVSFAHFVSNVFGSKGCSVQEPFRIQESFGPTGLTKVSWAEKPGTEHFFWKGTCLARKRRNICGRAVPFGLFWSPLLDSGSTPIESPWLHQLFPATFRKLRNSATLMEFICFVMSWNGINF